MNRAHHDIPNVTLVAKIVSIMKVPSSRYEVRKKAGLSVWGARGLLDKLLKCQIIKVQKEGGEGHIFIITPKGHEFLRRYKNLLKALGLDAENPKALEPIP